MTQDAPLDQTALEAAIAWAQEGTRDDTFSALTFDEHGALIERAIGIFLDALSRRVPASGGEPGWRYSINYGPDGEEDWANLITPSGEHVANIRTHHAIAIVNALAAAPSIPEGKAEPVAYRFVPKEQTTVEDHIWRFAAMHPGDQWRVEPLFVAPVQP